MLRSIENATHIREKITLKETTEFTPIRKITLSIFSGLNLIVQIETLIV